MSGFAPGLVRRIFFERDKERCFRCQKWLRWEQRGTGWSMHHRLPRGMGGSSDPVVNGAANAVTLCGSGTTGCHGWIEQHRAIAEDHGYIVRRGIVPPSGIRIKKSDGIWVMLTSSGLTVEVEGEAR